MTNFCKRALAMSLSTVLALSSAAPTTMAAVASFLRPRKLNSSNCSGTVQPHRLVQFSAQ